jgi:hypothetical protein
MSILFLLDQGLTPAQIAAALGLKVGKVYAVLRKERPGRTRAPRSRTSAKRALVIALAQAGVGATRIAVLCEVSRAYVYRILQEEGAT